MVKHTHICGLMNN